MSGISQPHFFPTAFPDESLFSLIARYHRLSGNLEDRDTLRELFGKHTQVVTSHLPSLVDRLIATLPSSTSVDAQAIIDRHTVFPYFKPFLTERQISLSLMAMKGNSASALKPLIGLVASKVGGNNSYRYCAKCIDNDVACYGQAYWHRSHQLPAVLICQEHGHLLHELNPSWVSLNRQRLFLPTSREVIQNSKLVSVSPVAFNPLLSVAILSRQVLHSGSAPIPRGQLTQVYRNLASDLGLLHKGGRLCVAGLSALIKQQTSVLASTEAFEFTQANNSNVPAWALALLRKPRKSIHPLKHILLLHFLKGSWTDIANGLDHVSDSSQQRNRPVNSPQSPCPRPGQQLVSMLIDKKYSLQRCAVLLGLSVTTVRIEAAKLGLPVKTKPKTFNETKLAKVCEELNSTTPLEEVACCQNVSVVSLYRILRMHPDVAHARKRLLFEQECTTRRERFLRGSQKSGFRNLPDYAWLYKNDRQWLAKTINAAPPIKRGTDPRIKWETRDRQFAKEVHATSKQMLALEKPVRLSKASLGRIMGNLAILEKHLEKLPLTSLALSKNVETVEQFQCRRLLWAAKHILDQQPSAPAWQLLRVAGLRPQITEETRSLLADLSTCTDIKQVAKIQLQVLPNRINGQ